MAKTVKKRTFAGTRTTKEERTTDAVLIAAGLIDRDPYSHMTDAERSVQAAEEAAHHPLNMLRERLLKATGLKFSDTELRKYLKPQGPFLLRAFLTADPESSDYAKRLVLDTAVANIKHFGKRSTTLRGKTLARYQEIGAEVLAVSEELSERGTKRVKKDWVNTVVAERRCSAGDKRCDVRTVRRARKALGI